MLHPWHEVSAGDGAPEILRAIVEIPRGSRTKYEVDKPTGLIKVDRVLYGAMFYPINYGFIPQSLGDDMDPLDILVMSSMDFVPLSVVEARVIGVMQMIDTGKYDDKIIAVACHDASVNHYQDISELPPHFSLELRNFFEEYKKLEQKEVTINEFLGKEAALPIIERSFEFYREHFPK
jgi:inorganic pyrophosphatase